MHFFKVATELYRPFSIYLMAIALICLAYIIGNIPFLFFVEALNATTNDPGEWMELLQKEYGKTTTLILLLAPWALVCLSFFPIARYVLKWPLLQFFTSRVSFDWKRFFFGFTVWFAISIVVFLIQFNDNMIWQFNWSYFIALFFFSAIILFLQCTAEELLFRSFFFKIAGQFSVPVFIQLLFSGFIFGYLHSSNPEVDVLGKIALVYYIGTGLFLGFVVYVDKGIEVTMGFHFANNFFAAIVVTSSWQVFQTDAMFLDTNSPTFGIVEIASSMLTQLVFFLICWKKFKWRINIKAF